MASSEPFLSSMEIRSLVYQNLQSRQWKNGIYLISWTTKAIMKLFDLNIAQISNHYPETNFYRQIDDIFNRSVQLIWKFHLNMSQDIETILHVDFKFCPVQ